MPRRSTRRRNRNRPRRRRVNSSLRQVSSGIPITKQLRGDPPPLNLVDSTSIKVRFCVNLQLASATADFNVHLATTPIEQNVCTFTAPTSMRTFTGYLSFSEIAQAAAVRHYGAIPPAGSLNSTATEYSISIVRLFGPPFSGVIRLGFDPGLGLPGAYASDIGTASNRPAVVVKAPRLFWRRADGTDEDTVSIWFADMSPPASYGLLASGSTATISNLYQIGVLDITVSMRRSAFAVPGSLTVAKTSNLGKA